MLLQMFWISMAIIHVELNDMEQEWPQGNSQEAIQCFPKYEVGDIIYEFWMSTMWDIWRFIIPPRRWSHWSFYICSYCRIGKQNKGFLLINHPILWRIFMTVRLMTWNKGGYMDEDGCGSSGVWNIQSDISLDNVFLSFYCWGLLQVRLCNRSKCFSAGMDWSLDQINNL